MLPLTVLSVCERVRKRDIEGKIYIVRDIEGKRESYEERKRKRKRKREREREREIKKVI